MSCVVQLGGIALGTTQTVAHGSALKAYPTDLVSVEDHIAALAERYGNLANSTRAAIDATAEAGDADTAAVAPVPGTSGAHSRRSDRTFGPESSD